MVRKVISGGQTGADQAGLYAALRLGLKTGGWAPRKFICELGARPELLGKVFGLQEIPDTGQTIAQQYATRTAWNVKDADVTFLFGDPESVGSKLTVNLCAQHGTPCVINPTEEEILTWCSRVEVQVVNIAGNRESKSPGIHGRVYDLLLKALLPEENT